MKCDCEAHALHWSLFDRYGICAECCDVYFAVRRDHRALYEVWSCERFLLEYADLGGWCGEA